jgi:VanZ family protein
MQTRKVTRLSRVLLIAAVVGIFALAITRSSVLDFGQLNDKLDHLMAFFSLALLADLSWPAARFNALKILSLLGYGIVIEIAQYYVGYRHVSLLDIGANAAGLFAYAMMVALLKALFSFKLRWE